MESINRALTSLNTAIDKGVDYAQQNAFYILALIGIAYYLRNNGTLGHSRFYPHHDSFLQCPSSDVINPFLFRMKKV